MKRWFKRFRKNVDEYVEELWDEWEIADYFEDICEEASDFFKNFFKPYKPGKRAVKQYRSATVYGVMQLVRPAYVFAERVDNMLKVIFSISIITSALIASFWGFTRLSELIEFLIISIAGRIVLCIIGVSYLLIAVWKLIHLKGQ